MNKETFRLFLWGAVLLAFVLLLADCASVNSMYANQAEHDAYAGDFQKALAQVDKSKAQYEKDKNTISYMLDRGSLNHYRGAYSESSGDLESASYLIEEASTKDISDRVNAFVSGNLKKMQYPGEDFEDLYLNIFNALNYYQQGKSDEALVEVRQVNEKMLFLTEKYKAEELTWKRTWENFRGIPAELNFSNSALARYLAVLLWRSANHPDDARIDAEEIANAFSDYPDVYNFPIPKTLVMKNGVSDETSVPKGQARLNIISFTGLSSVKSRPVDGYFWSRWQHVFYGGFFHFSGLNNTPQAKKVQVNLDTLRPILATFIHYCYKTDTTWQLRDTAWMLEDLSVLPGIDAQLQDILDAWDKEVEKDRDDRDFSDAAQKAIQLSRELYGDDGSGYAYDSESMDALDFFSTFWEKGIKMRARQSGVTRIEVVFDEKTSFSLDLLEDIGKVVEVLQKRREIRDEVALFSAARSRNINTKFTTNMKELSAIVHKDRTDQGILESMEDAAKATVGTLTLLPNTILFVAERNLTLLTDIFGTKSMMDAAAARKVNKELGRLDDRMALFFPDKAYVGGITLAPGVYSFTINYFNGSELLYSERHENVTIREEKLNLIESFYLKAR